MNIDVGFPAEGSAIVTRIVGFDSQAHPNAEMLEWLRDRSVKPKYGYRWWFESISLHQK